VRQPPIAPAVMSIPSRRNCNDDRQAGRSGDRGEMLVRPRAVGLLSRGDDQCRVGSRRSAYLTRRPLFGLLEPAPATTGARPLATSMHPLRHGGARHADRVGDRRVPTGTRPSLPSTRSCQATSAAKGISRRNVRSFRTALGAVSEPLNMCPIGLLGSWWYFDVAPSSRRRSGAP